MPDVYGPFTAQTWTQAQWFRDAWARDVSGVYGGPFATPAAGDLGLTVSGLTVTMALGRAHVRGAGYERTGTAWSYTVPANTATNPRIDRLVLRRDLAAGTVLPTVLQGTAAASPAEPALTQTEDGVWDLPLSSWTTPANSGAPVTAVTDERPPGGTGQIGTDTDWQNITISTGFAVNGTETPQVRKRSGVLFFRGSYAATGLTAAANFNVGTLPSSCLPTGLQNNIGGVGIASSSGDATATGNITSSGVISIRTASTMGSFYRLDGFSGLFAG